MRPPRVTLADGNGGRRMRALIDAVFRGQLANPALDTTADAARLSTDSRELVMTTDGFTVQPLEFPGGDIGMLAVHGTVNDLAVSGARPRWLSLGAIIEEGLEMDRLERIVASIAVAAGEAGVVIVTGDTKVVPRGQGGGLYLTTCGVGERLPGGRSLAMAAIRPGDRLLVSGPVGDHGVAVMLAREQFGLRGNLRSDAACVLPLTAALLGLDELRFMRDPTRGGLATVMHEIVAATGHGVRLDEGAIPIRTAVRSVCDMLGYDPLFLACEGRVVAVIGPDQATEALQRWRDLPSGDQAAIIGTVIERTSDDQAAGVILATTAGGERWIEELEDDPLPRIC